MECAERFSVDGRKLGTGDIRVIIEPLTPWIVQREDIVITVFLYHDKVRVENGDRHAAEMAAALATDLKNRMVGVSLVFSEIAWASA